MLCQLTSPEANCSTSYPPKVILDYSSPVASAIEKTLESIAPELLRPSKTVTLKANTNKAKKILGFKAKTKIKDLIKIMMDDELLKYNV